jgi:hypothetical protein
MQPSGFPLGFMENHGDSVLTRVWKYAALYTQWSPRSDTSFADSLYHHGGAKDLAPHNIICTPDFYLLFFVCFVTMGAALSLLDNIPQILCAILPTHAYADITVDALTAAQPVDSDASAVSQRLLLIGGDFLGLTRVARGLLGQDGVDAKGPHCGGTGGAIAHMGQMLLVVFSVCNTIGRIVAGFWPEQALHKHVRSSSAPHRLLCN